MARKPNYRIERVQRERNKAAKKAAKLKAKRDKADAKRNDEGGALADPDDTGDLSATEDAAPAPAADKQP